MAVLVPSNKLMIDVSDYLEGNQKFANGKQLPIIDHEVALETAGPSLAAVLIAGLIESGSTMQEIFRRLIHDLCEHIRGRKGTDPPSKDHLALSAALKAYLKSGKIFGSKRQLVIDECYRIANACRRLEFTGDPGDDWLTIRKLLAGSSSEFIRQVAFDAKYLRLLHKGAVLRSNLSNLWRVQGNYSGAAEAVRDALLQEHFAASTKVWTGINVMTIHKAKGKEFDEVIIYEGYYNGKIVPNNASKKELDQARLKLRVAVTRARLGATILTPSKDMCSLL